MPTAPSLRSPSRLTALAVAGTLIACATNGTVPGQAHISAQDLASFPAGVDPQLVPDFASILAVTPEMSAFVARHVDRNARPGQRLEQLVQGMLDENLLALEFELGRTRTAAQTFNARRGNCLSFTNLFVALAREAGLDVGYQLIEVPPSWERNGRWVVADNHINAILHDMRIDGSHRWNYVVDFNMADFKGHYPREEIEDQRAFALFYNNRGAELLQLGQIAQAQAYFTQAHELNPKMGALWVNLGSLYRIQGQNEHAQSAYLTALRLDPHAPAALSNLASLYQVTGQLKWARQVEQRLSQLKEQDPYYYYQRSLAAYQIKQWSEAERQLAKATRLKNDEPQFAFLKARLDLSQGHTDKARAQLERAHALAATPQSRALYSSKLDRLIQTIDNS